MYTAIVATENNRIIKFAEFADEPAANAHCAKHGGFVCPGAYSPDLYVVGETVTLQPEVIVPTIKDYDIAIERHLDAEAEAAGYYDPLHRIPPIDRACSYAAFTNEYQAEGQSFVSWRAAVWAYAYQVKLDVQNNVRAQPTIEELLAELPSRLV